MMNVCPDNGQSLFNLTPEQRFECVILEAAAIGTVGRFIQLLRFDIYNIGKNAKIVKRRRR